LSPAEPDPEEGTHASQRLLKSERDAYRSVFDHNPVPMLLCEVGTLRVAAANLAACKLHGASAEQMQGTSLFELRRVSDLTSMMLKRAVGHEVALGFGYHTRKDGSTFPVQLTVHPSELGGRPVWLCILKSLDELLLPREGEQQRRILEAIGRIAGGVAHDINNLLSVILSFGSLAASQLPTTSPAQSDLSEIRGAAERATALTKQLLSLSRKGPATPKPLQLNDVIKRMEKLLRRLLDEQLGLELELAPDVEQVLADATQVERLLVQLVSEARAGSGKPGRLLIETRNVELDSERGGERHVMLRVSDSESAITPEVASLSAFVESGNAWLESEPGAGARFVACFPSVKGKPTGMVAEPRKVRRETVLVVQDNPHLRKTLKTYFAREGYRVLDADSSLEALRLIEHEARVDLLLTDFVLTDGTGSELARALRERLPSLRVLVAIGNPEQRAALREDDRTAIISKPFDLQEFGSRVKSLVDLPDLGPLPPQR
jgi:two-component system, cell cycle sensor histidine kinase and response regulator CckA